MGHTEPVPSRAAPTVPATGVRYGVFAFLCSLTFVLYLDRMCMGKTAPFIQRDLTIDNEHMGWVHASFTVAYGLFEVVTGRWGDRYGSRRVLTRIVIWWSIFTALTGAATGLVSLLMVRFLFGAGEAGALPNAARIVRLWFPIQVRGFVQGAITTPMLLGGTVAPVATAYLIEKVVGWQFTFVLYGAIGLVWALAFWLWFRDEPGEHWAVNEAERHLISGHDVVEHHDAPHTTEAAIPWLQVLCSRNVWLLGTIMTCGSATVYMLFSWYPTYLEKARGTTNIQAGWLTSMVMLGGAVGCALGGWASDAIHRTVTNRRWSRSGLGAAVYFLAAVAMFAGTRCETALGSSCYIALVCLCVHAHVGAWWGSVGDISGQHLGALFGLMNSMGLVGAISSQLFFGYVPEKLWTQSFYLYVVLLLLGSCCWALVDPRQVIEKTATPE